MTTGWLCFHCGEYFNTKKLAELHFGKHISSSAACQIKAEDGGLVSKIRTLEAEIETFRLEDTDLHREIYRLAAEMNRKVQEAEELGYKRGLQETRMRG